MVKIQDDPIAFIPEIKKEKEYSFNNKHVFQIKKKGSKVPAQPAAILQMAKLRKF